MQKLKEALFYKKSDGKKVICELCPHNCTIKHNNTGICRVRLNKDGLLYSETHGSLAALNFDPIEKKPLYHYYPGRTVFSIGTIGCNLDCKFCQNCDISQANTKNFPHLKPYIVPDIIKMALKHQDNIGIAYTYNEPVVYYEYMHDIAKEAKLNNLKNVMVSNGYINGSPLEELLNYIDAFNIDLKGFDEKFYKKYTGANLNPVLETLKTIKSKDKHLEITNLVIPTLNDDEKLFEDMVKWIAQKLGKEIPLHISRYFPRYKMNIHATPTETLEKFYEIANKHLSFVYIGNDIKVGNNTFCNNCGKKVIERSGYYIYKSGLDIRGNCLECGNNIIKH